MIDAYKKLIGDAESRAKEREAVRELGLSLIKEGAKGLKNQLGLRPKLPIDSRMIKQINRAASRLRKEA